jgi:hypothetical protein
LEELGSRDVEKPGEVGPGEEREVEEGRIGDRSEDEDEDEDEGGFASNETDFWRRLQERLKSL